MKKLLVLVVLVLAVIAFGIKPILAADPGVSITFGGEEPVSDGLALSMTDPEGDGPISLEGGFLSSVLNKHYPNRFIYFKVDDDYAKDMAEDTTAKVIIEVKDEGKGTLMVQYDSYVKGAPVDGAYANSKSLRFTGAGGWLTLTFDLPKARFVNRQNGDSDFRIQVMNRDFTLRKVTVISGE